MLSFRRDFGVRISRKKLTGYRLYGLLYRIFTLLPANGNRAYFIMTHDCSDEGNCGVMKALMEKRGFRCDALTRAEASSAGFIAKSAYRLARSRFIFCDNTFLPLAFLKLRKKSILTQLWHGTGTIKKFGQDVNTGELKALEARCGQNITHLIVSSPATKSIYAGCFGVPEDRVDVLGLPRTDAFFAPGFAENARTRLEKDYPALAGKKLILYAPTFRDDADDENEQIEKIREFAQAFTERMSAEYVLGLRLHPFVSAKLKGLETGARILDLTSYRGANTLIGSADALITDYSSIIFEYSLLKRPMLFYAYDLARFESNDRGFYRDYRSYVPGPVFTGRDETLSALSEILASGKDIVHRQESDLNAAEKTVPDTDAFISDSFSFTDGRSAGRILEHILASSGSNKL